LEDEGPSGTREKCGAEKSQECRNEAEKAREEK